MPMYLYKEFDIVNNKLVSDGIEITKMYKFSDRPKAILLYVSDDDKDLEIELKEETYIDSKIKKDEIEYKLVGVFKYTLGAHARMSRSWNYLGQYGLNGRYDKTLSTVITSDKQREKLALEKGLVPVHSENDLSNFEKKLNDRETKYQETMKNHDKYNQVLKECNGDHIKAYDITYRDREEKILRSETKNSEYKNVNKQDLIKSLTRRGLIK